MPTTLSLLVNVLHLCQDCVIIDTSGLKVSCTGSVGLELAAGKDGKAVGSEVGQYTVWHSSNIPCYYGPCVVIDRSFC